MTACKQTQLLTTALQDYDGEADVIMAFVSDSGCVVVYPHWECEIPVEELPKKCLETAIRLADEIGNGGILGDYVDKRTK